MIIRPSGPNQVLLTQPDHAALAGRIMQQWAADDLAASPRRAEILLAVAEHDNGWQEVDAAPLVDPATGAILDFIRAPDVVRQGVWPRGIERLADTPYAAALVAQHALEIYARYRTEPGWAPFFGEMEAARGRHLQRASAALEELRRDYFFVRAGDLISLTFCNGWRADQAIGSRYALRPHADELVVAPDPFAGRIVAIDIGGVEVFAASFASAPDALEAFRRGPTRRVTGTLRGSDGLLPPSATPATDAGAVF